MQKSIVNQVYLQLLSGENHFVQAETWVTKDIHDKIHVNSRAFSISSLASTQPPVN